MYCPESSVSCAGERRLAADIYFARILMNLLRQFLVQDLFNLFYNAVHFYQILKLIFFNKKIKSYILILNKINQRYYLSNNIQIIKIFTFKPTTI